jgi:hypothetical protein
MYETGEQEETRMLPPAGLRDELEHAEGSRTARGQTEEKKTMVSSLLDRFFIFWQTYN